MGEFTAIDLSENDKDSIDILRINRSKKMIVADLFSFVINDGEYKVEIIPSLSISGYGKTLKSARKMVSEGVHDYFETLVNLSIKELEAELLKYHWHKSSPYKNKEFSNSSYVDKKGVLRNLNLPEDTPIEKRKVQFA